MSAGSPTPFDTLLADLTTNMHPILHTWGEGPSQRRRVEWSRKSWSYVRYPRGEQHDGEVSLGRFDHVFEVNVYGDSDADVAATTAQTIGWIDILEGPPSGCPSVGDPGDSDYIPERLGYDVKLGTPPRGGNGKAAQYVGTLEVTLRSKVASMFYLSKAAEEVAVAVIATDTDGTDPQTGVSLSVS